MGRDSSARSHARVTGPPNRQIEIYLAGARGRRPRVPVDARALEEAARRKLTAQAFAYLAGGAGAESTIAANREGFDRLRIIPRVLRDVSARDTSVELFGRRIPAPIFASPVGVLELAHEDADLAVARATASLGMPMVFSSQASIAMERCAREMGNAPRWFQLYWSKDDELVQSFVARAEACGCEAIVVTLDTTLLGWRTRDLDLAYLPFLQGRGIAQYTSDGVFMRKLHDPLSGPAPTKGPITIDALLGLARMASRIPGGTIRNLRTGDALAAVRRFIATYSRPSLAWTDLPRLRAITRLPIILKGVLHPDDARRASDAGIDGVIVSNHGGRQIDGAIAAIDALPAVVDAASERLTVLMDSGVRGGADVFRALALGARAVGIGRPYAYGLALAGEAGVREVLANLITDFDLTMGLAGCSSLSQIDRGAVTKTP